MTGLSLKKTVKVVRSNPGGSKDDLFGASRRTNTIEVVEKKKKKKTDAAAPLPSLGLGLVKSNSNKNVLRIEPLMSSKYLPGCQALGFVLSFSGRSALVSLPGGCIGTLFLSEVSDVLHKMSENSNTALPSIDQVLKIQQPVLVSVLAAAEDDRKITLSSRLSLIHRGLALKHLFSGQLIPVSVVSKEDHGYVMSSGINGVTFFLRISKEAADLVVGQNVNCVIKDINLESRSVLLRLYGTNVKEEPVRLSSIPFVGLSAGMRFEVVVDKKIENGLLVSYLNLFHGAVDLNSLSANLSSDAWKEYSVLSSLHARIVFIDHANKVVRMSVKPHIMAMRCYKNLPALGSIIENISVLAVNKKSGLIAEVTHEEEDIDPVAVQIPLKLLESPTATGDSTTSPADSYVDGQGLGKVRISGYHLVEGLCVGTNKLHVVDGDIAHCSDVQVGQVHDVVLTSIEDFGVTCKIADKISAVCPKIHCGDVVVDGKLNKKFKVGQVIKMRVWEASNGAIIVTNKKSLVELTDGYLDDYCKAEPGHLAVGVVSKIHNFGITVRFFNKLTGEISSKILTKQGVLNPQESFRVGQILRTVVVDRSSTVRADSKLPFYKLSLALDMNVNSTNISEYQALLRKSNPSPDTADLCVSGTIIEKGDDALQIRLDDGRLALLSKIHTYEFASTAEELFDDFKVDQRIVDACIFGRQGKTLLLTLKPLLRLALSSNADGLKIPKRIADLTPGEAVAGVIAKVENFGVIIKFDNSVTALAPRPSIADRFVSSPIGLFAEGDSVRCIVQRVDLQKERAVVALKSSMVPSLTEDSLFLRSHLRERFLVAKHASTISGKMLPAWQKYALGSVVSCKVSTIAEYGVVLFSEDQSTVFVDKLTDRRKIKEGDAAKVLILDYDFENSIVDVKILDKAAAKKSAADQSILPSGNFEMTIELVKDKYLVVSRNRVIAFLPVADFNNPKPDMNDFKPGNVVTVSVWKKPSENELLFPHGKATFVQRGSQSGVSGQLAESEPGTSNGISSGGSEFLKFGQTHTWTIVSIYASEVKLSPDNSDLKGVQGVIHISSTLSTVANDQILTKLKSFVDGDDRTALHSMHPFHEYEVGQKLNCQCLLTRKIKSDSDDADVIAYLQAVSPATKNELPSPVLQLHGANEIISGSVYPGCITRISTTGCTISLSPFVCADLPFLEVSNDIKLLKHFRDRCFIGQQVTVAVTSIVKDQKNPSIRLSRAIIEDQLDKRPKVRCSELSVKQIQDASTAEEGALVTGMLDFSRKAPRAPAFTVALPGNKFGRLCLTELSDTDSWVDLVTVLHDLKSDRGRLVAQLPNGLATGSFVKCRILSVKDNDIEVSIRKSRVVSKKDSLSVSMLTVLGCALFMKECAKAKDAIRNDAMPLEGQIVNAFVTSVSEKGCFLRVSSKVTGRVLLRDLSDSFIENPSEAFPVGKLVQARVQTADVIHGTVQLNLKPSVVLGSLEALKDIRKLKEGQFVMGVVERVNEIGVFVRINDTSLVGLSRKATSLDDTTQALTDAYAVGDVVKAKVLRVSESTVKVALGLAPSYLRSSNADGDNDDDEDDGAPEHEKESVSGESSDQDDAIDIDSDDEGEELIEQQPKVVKNNKPKLQTSKSMALAKELEEEPSSRKRRAITEAADDDDDDGLGELQWEAGKQSLLPKKTNSFKDDSDGSDLDEDEMDEKSSKLRSRQKEAARKKTEKELRNRELALAEGRLVPESTDDFERLLIAKPNSSFLWIHYIAHHLNNADVEAARTIANRALRSIHFREEEEKFNVWMALLNMEYKYGNKESLEKVFSQAISESNVKQIFLGVAKIYEEAGDKTGCSELFERALKKPQLKKSKKVWIAYHTFKLRSGDPNAAKELLKRSLMSLSRHKHVEVISKYALAEFDFGSADRARVLFEDLLNSYPKRTDIWHLYVDKEIKLGHFSQARQLFERMIASKSSTRNMKTIFKKYLSFETMNGNEQTQELVKQKAREYVQSLA